VNDPGMADRPVLSDRFRRLEEVEEDGGEESDEELGEDDEEIVNAEDGTGLGSGVGATPARNWWGKGLEGCVGGGRGRGAWREGSDEGLLMGGGCRRRRGRRDWEVGC
jgi:hypothetical protein